MTTITISSLPSVLILEHVLPHLSIKDTIRFGATNRFHNSLAKTDIVWRQKANDLGLLIHEDAENIYFIVKNILKNFYKNTYQIRSRLKLDFTEIKPTSDENINEIAKRIEYFKTVSIAIFWKELLNRFIISRKEYYKYIPRPTTCPFPVYHNLQSEGLTVIQKEFDLWLDEKKHKL